MKLSRRAKKRLAAAAAILVLLFILTSPKYHSGSAAGVNGTSDYYEVYYGNGTAGVKETWIELHSPTDLFAYYYCTDRPGLQVGVFVLGYVDYGSTAAEGMAEPNLNATSADGIGALGSENSTAANGNGSQSGSVNSSGDSTALAQSSESCFGIISPIPAAGELNPYGTGLRVCYGLRLVESRSCAY